MYKHSHSVIRATHRPHLSVPRFSLLPRLNPSHLSVLTTRDAAQICTLDCTRKYRLPGKKTAQRLQTRTQNRQRRLLCVHYNRLVVPILSRLFSLIDLAVVSLTKRSGLLEKSQLVCTVTRPLMLTNRTEDIRGISTKRKPNNSDTWNQKYKQSKTIC